MKILLTGAAGFIGSHLCEALLNIGHKVTGVDNFDQLYDRSVKERNLEISRESDKFSFAELDLKDFAATQALLEQGFDRVVHLAGRGGNIIPDDHGPMPFVEDNYLATMNLLEAMRKTGTAKLVYASGACVYGKGEHIPFREDTVPDFVHSHSAATKRACELLCNTYNNMYSVEVYILRLFTVYGPRQRPDMAVSSFVNAITQRRSLVRYGDGTSERDYVYISDVVEALVKAVERVEGFECFNIGTGSTTSLSSLIGYIEEFLGQEAVISEHPVPTWSALRTFADISKAGKMLGYSPAVDIREGLLSFIQWYRKEQKV